MSGGLLLDTHALVWTVESDPRAGRVRAILADAADGGLAVHVSPISAHEVGLLVRRRRLRLSLPVRDWFAAILATRAVRVAEMTIDVLIDATDLPALDHKDPADRIIIATARKMGLTLVTRDRAILSYAAQGHVLALEC